MSHTLSDALSNLASKTKAMENNIAQSRAETKEKLEARIAKAKAAAEAQQKEFIERTEAVKATINSDISKAKNSFEEKVSQLQAQAKAKKAEIEEKLAASEHKRDVNRAKADYDDAINYAENSVNWALIALSEVEEATLEAYDAKINYDGLKNT